MSLVKRSSRLFALRKEQFTDQVIVMEKTETESEIGSVETTWTEGTELKAMVSPQSAEEVIRSGRIEAEQAVIVELDYAEAKAEGLDAEGRLKWRGKTLHIHGTEDVHSAGEIMRLTCTQTS